MTILILVNYDAFNLNGKGNIETIRIIWKTTTLSTRLACAHRMDGRWKTFAILSKIKNRLAHASHPLKFCHFAFETSIYFINRMLTSTLQKTILISFKALEYSFLKIFGRAVFSLLRAYNSWKFDEKWLGEYFMTTTRHEYTCFNRVHKNF